MKALSLMVKKVTPQCLSLVMDRQTDRVITRVTGLEQKLCEILSRSNLALWPRHGFKVCVHCDLDLWNLILGQGHDTPLGHGQHLCEILSRSNLAVRSYGLDTNFGYVCTVTLTFAIWPWVQVIAHSWVIDNNCVKYNQDSTQQWGVMARTWI